jgi:hypothetical protein
MHQGEIMKKQISVLVIGSVLTLLIAATAHAQLPGSPVRVSIPFDFIVRGKTLPAGIYEITRVNDQPIDLMIRSLDHKRYAEMFDTESVYVKKEPSKDVVVFHRYGDSYFLAEVLTAGEQTGRELMTSRAERHLKRELAKNEVVEPETVTVASN